MLSDIQRRRSGHREIDSPLLPFDRFPSRSPARRSRSRSPLRKSSIRNFSPQLVHEDREPNLRLSQVVDPFDLVEKDTRSTREESSPDPFDIASSKSPSQNYTSLIVSTLDNKSIEALTLPLTLPPDSSNFNRTVSTRIEFGYLSSLDAEKVLSNSSPYSNDEELQIRYENFLEGQRGEKEYYYNVLEKVKEYSARNKKFSDMAKVLVDFDRK